MENLYKFKEICSDKTLYTNSEGFFLNILKNVTEIIGENWIKNVFNKINCDEERIQCIYQKPIKPILDEVFDNVREVYRGKDGKLSEKKRLEAERSYENGDFNKALLIYSQSILKAPLKNIGGLFVKRAFVHLNKNNPKFALCDLELGLYYNISSDTLKGEVFLKIGLCYKALGDVNKSKIYLKKAKKRLISRKFNELMKQQINSIECEEIKEENKEIKSNKMFIKHTIKAGRYYVAKEKIKTGELLLVEHPYAAILNPQHFGTHCQNCLKRLKNPIPCEICSSVVFCSIECRNLAEFHKIECKYLDLFIGSGMSPLTWLALRMITQFDYETLIKNYNNGDVYKLCTHADKREGVDFFKRTIMTSFLVKILEKSGYIKGGKSLKLGEIILKNLQILQFNAHEIMETLHSENKFKFQNIGIGIYERASLFNHDCYPGVFRVFQGKSIVLKAMRPFDVNDIIPENYGPIFTLKTLEERQLNLLGRYWFKCECKSCMEKWPLLKNLNANRIKCPNIKCDYLHSLPLLRVEFKCPHCKVDVNCSKNLNNYNQCLELYNLGMEYFNKGDFKEATNILIDAIDQFNLVSCAPHKETHLAEETLRKCLMLYGNTLNC